MFAVDSHADGSAPANGLDSSSEGEQRLFGQMITVPLLNEHRILTQVAGP